MRIARVARPALSALLSLTLVPPASSLAAQEAAGDRLRVFLDCQRCDFDHLRREVPVVDYVRDRADADVHVLVTQERTGAGGSEYSFLFLGRRGLAGRADTLRFASQQVQTDDEVRAGYTRTLALGLVRYLAYAGAAAPVDVVFREPGDAGRVAPAARDPWNLWVFRASLGAEVEGERRTSTATFDGSFSASRTTEAFKIDLNVNGDYEREEFDLADRTEVSLTREARAEATAVWSVSPHWSWGVSGSVSAETRLNQALAYRLRPALEYSFYPYTESTRRQITALYRAGVAVFRYDEITLFDRTRETRPEHSLEIAADFQQPWGELVVSVEGSHFLDDPSQHRVDVFTNMEIRIVRGLSLDVRGNVARIKDQIYEPREDASDEDILLRRRALGTDFEYSVEIGVSFTFGSVFNNVVNPRIRTGGRRFF